MASTQLQLDLIIEEDRNLGMPVFHLFPSHQEHIPEIGCPCKPHLGDIYETDRDNVLVEVWWHFLKRSINNGL